MQYFVVFLTLAGGGEGEHTGKPRTCQRVQSQSHILIVQLVVWTMRAEREGNVQGSFPL